MNLTKGEYGEVRIHNEVVIAIVRRAALEVEGVEKIASGFKKVLLSFIGRRKFARGVAIERTKENEIRLTLSIVIQFGANIPRVVNRVQTNIRNMLEQITGAVPLEVNVEVERIAQEIELGTVLEKVESKNKRRR